MIMARIEDLAERYGRHIATRGSALSPAHSAL